MLHIFELSQYKISKKWLKWFISYTSKWPGKFCAFVMLFLSYTLFKSSITIQNFRPLH